MTLAGRKYPCSVARNCAGDQPAQRAVHHEWRPVHPVSAAEHPRHRPEHPGPAIVVQTVRAGAAQRRYGEHRDQDPQDSFDQRLRRGAQQQQAKRDAGQRPQDPTASHSCRCTSRQSCATTTAATVIERSTATGAAILTGRTSASSGTAMSASPNPKADRMRVATTEHRDDERGHRVTAAMAPTPTVGRGPASSTSSPSSRRSSPAAVPAASRWRSSRLRGSRRAVRKTSGQSSRSFPRPDPRSL